MMFLLYNRKIKQNKKSKINIFKKFKKSHKMFI